MLVAIKSIDGEENSRSKSYVRNLPFKRKVFYLEGQLARISRLICRELYLLRNQTNKKIRPKHKLQHQNDYSYSPVLGGFISSTSRLGYRTIIPRNECHLWTLNFHFQQRAVHINFLGGRKQTLIQHLFHLHTPHTANYDDFK